MKLSILSYVSLAIMLMMSFVHVDAHDTTRTITVTGKSEINLSPNEIIIKINFEEYFTNKEETPESKITIEELEKKVLKAVYSIGVAKDKVTSGAATVVKPYDNKTRTYKKRRLNKGILICVGSTKEYIILTRKLETENLFDQIVTGYSIAEYRHSEKKKYLDKSRSEAYDDAYKKANLILSNSKQKVGRLIRIKELSVNYNASVERGSFYKVSSQESLETSGFKPIVITYELVVTFQLVE